MKLSKENESDVNFNQYIQDAIFVKQHLWMVESKGLSSFAIKSVKLNFTAKILHLNCYEIWKPEESIDLLTWINNLKDDKNLTLNLTTTTSNRMPIYKYTFSGLSLQDDSIEFDYDSSNINLRKLTISYEDMETWENESANLYQEEKDVKPLYDVPKSQDVSTVTNLYKLSHDKYIALEQKINRLDHMMLQKNVQASQMKQIKPLHSNILNVLQYLNPRNYRFQKKTIRERPQNQFFHSNDT